MDANFWGCLVRKLRVERKMPQRTLAQAVGMNRSTIRNIEDGKNRDILRIDAVLTYFGYDLEALSQDNPNSRGRADVPALTGTA